MRQLCKTKQLEHLIPIYYITTCGRVISKYKNKFKILKHRINKHGYCQICLSTTTGKKQFLIHRLVALTYIENICNKPQVNHIDEVKTHNYVQNLEWTTPKENTNHGTGIYRCSIKRCKPVIQYDKKGNKLARFFSTVEASKLLNIPKDCISAVCRGDKKSIYGFVFRYDGDAFEKYEVKKDSTTSVIKMDKNGIILKIYDSIIEACLENNVKSSNIIACCKGTQKTAKGFMWSYNK